MSDDDRRELLDEVERDLAGIETALARLDAGDYFTCERCGAPLTDDRLALDPTATRCGCDDPAGQAAVDGPAAPTLVGDFGESPWPVRPG